MGKKVNACLAVSLVIEPNTKLTNWWGIQVVDENDYYYEQWVHLKLAANEQRYVLRMCKTPYLFKSREEARAVMKRFKAMTDTKVKLMDVAMLHSPWRG